MNFLWVSGDFSAYIIYIIIAEMFMLWEKGSDLKNGLWKHGGSGSVMSRRTRSFVDAQDNKVGTSDLPYTVLLHKLKQ